MVVRGAPEARSPNHHRGGPRCRARAGREWHEQILALRHRTFK